jgi:hypothetical protein
VVIARAAPHQAPSPGDKRGGGWGTRSRVRAIGRGRYSRRGFAPRASSCLGSYVGRRRDRHGVGWPFRPSDDVLCATAS